MSVNIAYGEKVIIQNTRTDELAAISEINSYTIKALKQWMNRIYQDEEDNFVVFHAVDSRVKEYFEEHIKKLKEA